MSSAVSSSPHIAFGSEPAATQSDGRPKRAITKTTKAKANDESAAQAKIVKACASKAAVANVHGPVHSPSAPSMPIHARSELTEDEELPDINKFVAPLLASFLMFICY